MRIERRKLQPERITLQKWFGKATSGSNNKTTRTVKAKRSREHARCAWIISRSKRSCLAASFETTGAGFPTGESDLTMLNPVICVNNCSRLSLQDNLYKDAPKYSESHCIFIPQRSVFARYGPSNSQEQGFAHGRVDYTPAEETARRHSESHQDDDKAKVFAEAKDPRSKSRQLKERSSVEWGKTPYPCSHQRSQGFYRQRYLDLHTLCDK